MKRVGRHGDYLKLHTSFLSTILRTILVSQYKNRSLKFPEEIRNRKKVTLLCN